MYRFYFHRFYLRTITPPEGFTRRFVHGDIGKEIPGTVKGSVGLDLPFEPMGPDQIVFIVFEGEDKQRDHDDDA